MLFTKWYLQCDLCIGAINGQPLYKVYYMYYCESFLWYIDGEFIPTYMLLTYIQKHSLLNLFYTLSLMLTLKHRFLAFLHNLYSITLTWQSEQAYILCIYIFTLYGLNYRYKQDFHTSISNSYILGHRDGYLFHMDNFLESCAWDPLKQPCPLVEMLMNNTINYMLVILLEKIDTKNCISFIWKNYLYNIEECAFCY